MEVVLKARKGIPNNVAQRGSGLQIPPMIKTWKEFIIFLCHIPIEIGHTPWGAAARVSI
jgi:hypothetical protein